jgi:hypothetical protein
MRGGMHGILRLWVGTFAEAVCRRVYEDPEDQLGQDTGCVYVDRLCALLEANLWAACEAEEPPPCSCLGPGAPASPSKFGAKLQAPEPWGFSQLQKNMHLSFLHGRSTAVCTYRLLCFHLQDHVLTSAAAKQHTAVQAVSYVHAFQTRQWVSHKRPAPRQPSLPGISIALRSYQFQSGAPGSFLSCVPGCKLRDCQA